MKKIIYLYILLISLSSCVKDPSSIQTENPANLSERYIFALCQGLWGADNSALTRIDLNNNSVTLDFYKSQNPGLFLGNTANDIVARGDTAYIALSFTNTIEALRLSNGKSLGRIILKDSSNPKQMFKPRKIAIYNDTIAYATLLSRNSIIGFNPKTLKLITNEIYSGAYPEGCVIIGDKLFVANSGYGYLGQSAERASSISVFNAGTGEFIYNFKTNTNPVEMTANSKNGRLYVSCYEVSADIKGYILEIDGASYQTLRTWQCVNTSINLSSGADSLIFVNTDGLNLIELNKSEASPHIIIANPNHDDNWFSCGISRYDNSFLIGNAKKYTENGEILRFNKYFLTLKSRSMCGINPGKILAK